MRENRPYGSEGGEAKSLPYPYRGWVRLNVQNDGSNSASCVHRIHPASVTTAKRPSVGRDGDGYTSDLGQTRSGIFLQPGLDRFLPDGQISCGDKRSLPVIARSPWDEAIQLSTSRR